MKTINSYYTSDVELLEFIEKNQILDSSKLLIQIFTAVNDSAFITTLMHLFKRYFPLCSLIGCTTDGEIKDGYVSTGKTVISFTLFDKTTLQIFLTNDFNDYFEAGRKLASKITTKNTKAIITFIDGLRGNGEEYLKGINATCSDVIVAGGLAGDNAKFENTYIFTKDALYSKGVVGVSLNSSALHVFTDFSFDWQTLGKTLTITQVDKNRVFKIDERTAVETYAYYLGENISKQLPKVAIEFPLIMQKNGIPIARAAISMNEDGSLVFAGNFSQGDKVRFGCADFDSILNNTQMHINKIADVNVESIFIYSCMARRRFMPNEIEYENLAYNKVAPTSGFYTYGEFFSTSTHKELLNQSMTILALSESSECSKKTIELSLNVHTNKTIQALSHLINISTAELDDLQKKLEFFSITDPLTKLHNRRYFTQISNDIFEISKRNATTLSLIVLDLDRFKVVNDTFGHKVGDDVLISFSSILTGSLRNSDISCRFGGEEFVVLLPDTNIEGALRVAENIRENTEQACMYINSDLIVKFTVSIGVSQIDFTKDLNIYKALERTDEALYIAKNNGRNQVAVK